MNRDAVEKIVRRVVYRTLGMSPSHQQTGRRRLITESDITAVPSGGQLVIPSEALVTPLARQMALDQKVSLITSSPGLHTAPERTAPEPPATEERKVAIGADHGGFEMKQMLKNYLVDLGFSVTDCGTNSTDAVDYPDFALAVAQLVAAGSVWRGIVVDGAGIGSAMTANKVPGVRAAMCYDQATAVNSREHNDANVLTLGAGLIGPSLAKQIVKTWLDTPSGGGRHARRVSKIMEVEKRFSKSELKEHA